MEATKYCVYNKTTDRFLSVGTTLADTIAYPLEFLEVPVNGDTMTAEWGVWLRPFDTIPTDPVRFPIDVVYLNENRRVVHGFELTPSDPWPQIEDRTASALILPYHSVDASRTYPGDQFIICKAEELVRHLARVPGARDSDPRAGYREEGVALSPIGAEVPANRVREKSTDPVITGKKAGSKGPRKLEVVPPPAAAPVSARQERGDSWRMDAGANAGSPSSAKRPQTNLEADEIESVVSQVLQWSRTAGGKAALDTGGLDATALPLGSGAAAGLPGANGTNLPRSLKITEGQEDPLQSLNRSEDQDVISQGDREEDGEFQSPDFEAVISQVMQWAEETGRPVARAQEPTRAAQSSAAVPGLSGLPSSRKPQNGATAGNGKDDGSSPKSRFGRWADDVTSPLAKTPGAKPETRLRVEAPGSSKGDRVSGVQAALHKFKKSGKVLFTAEGVHTLKTRFVNWLDEGDRNAKKVGPVDRRRSNRHALPDLIAYYWTGGTPQAHRVGDISSTGFYLLTKERWVPETVIRMTLQRTLAGGANSEDAISVLSKVVRWGEDGVGHEFILLDSVDMRSGKLTSGKERVQEALQQYL